MTYLIGYTSYRIRLEIKENTIMKTVILEGNLETVYTLGKFLHPSVVIGILEIVTYVNSSDPRIPN